MTGTSRATAKSTSSWASNSRCLPPSHARSRAETLAWGWSAAGDNLKTVGELLLGPAVLLPSDAQVVRHDGVHIDRVPRIARSGFGLSRSGHRYEHSQTLPLSYTSIDRKP